MGCCSEYVLAISLMFQFVVFPEVNLLIKFEEFFNFVYQICYKNPLLPRMCLSVSKKRFRIYIWLCAARGKEMEIKGRLSYIILDSQRNKCSNVRQMPLLERRLDRTSLDLKFFHVSSQETNVLACPNSDDELIYATKVIVHCWYYGWNKFAMFPDNAQCECAL